MLDCGGFRFQGLRDALSCADPDNAKFHNDEEQAHQIADENLQIELNRSLGARNLFANIATSQAEIKPGARALKLENTIIEFTKGGGAARYWVGLYGGGQPVLRSGGHTMVTKRCSALSPPERRFRQCALERLAMKDEDIQIEDIREMVRDLTDFISAIAGQYQPVN